MARTPAVRRVRTAVTGGVCVAIITAGVGAALQGGYAALMVLLCVSTALMAVPLRAVARPRATPYALLVAAVLGAVIPPALLASLWLGLAHPRLYTALATATVVLVACKVTSAVRREVCVWRAFHAPDDVVG